MFNFVLYRYIFDFLGTLRARVWPEFPTGNGKIDILIRYADRMYAVELKTYTDEYGYREAVAQAAH
ncbi:MAG: hypothetical protein AB7S75_07950 [Desulfococcaceae bacterium]